MTSTQAKQIESCPACKTKTIDESIEEFDGVCTGCGFVIHDGADTTGPDWIVADETKAQTDREEWLSECRIRNATEQQVAEAFGALEDFAGRLDLGVALRKETADTYCEAFCAGTTDGRETICLVAAALRLASQQAGKPVPTGRLTEIPDVDQKKFRLAYTALREDLDCSPLTLNPTDYLPFLSTTLKLSESQRQATERILEAVAGDSSLVGKDPVGIAATAIYLTDGDQTQSNIAKAAGVSTETIRLRSDAIGELMNCDG